MTRIAVQYALPRKGLPSATALRRAARAALRGAKRKRDTGVCLRLVGRAEAQRLNRAFRRKDYAPNVLAFDATGDVVICAPVVAREAKAQRKRPAAHWAHMVVHGTLHLLGHDHMNKADAARMERLERRVLASLGHPDPYD